MKMLAAFAAFALLSTAAYADGPRGSLSANVAARGGVINSATITQNSGAFAFAQITQGERASFDAPRYDPLITVEPGAFIMPFVGITGDGNENARVVVLDPIGTYDRGFEIEIDDIDVDFD